MPYVKIPLPCYGYSWEKKEGDQVSEGDLLCEIETDKATMGFETPEEGFLAKVMITAGTKDIPIGKTDLWSTFYALLAHVNYSSFNGKSNNRNNL